MTQPAPDRKANPNYSPPLSRRWKVALVVFAIIVMAALTLFEPNWRSELIADFLSSN